MNNLYRISKEYYPWPKKENTQVMIIDSLQAIAMKLTEIWNNSAKFQHNKFRILNTLIFPSATHESETRTLHLQKM